eukprot:Gregarina_sp_Poly_1__1396@NODE_1348_length_4319_cov_5_531279_g904_i0_p2_GENE_NODE_1348_length_4319_cov_5_531279_g904_i0NODE_1348_length_4319_cov_5_531279_g904_i0_p2_ORF_typecomplete_len169_score27_91Syntaxin6_N/PF09177_11/0_0079_NODE_1348_length_4319_cov_5_531279_g904_i05931099
MLIRTETGSFAARDRDGRSFDWNVWRWARGFDGGKICSALLENEKMQRGPDPYNIAEKSLTRDLHQLKSQLTAAEKEVGEKRKPWPLIFQCLASLHASGFILRPLIKGVDEFQRNLKVLEQAVFVSKQSPQAFLLSENDVRSRCAFLGDCQQAVLRIEERVRTLLVID